MLGKEGAVRHDVRHRSPNRKGGVWSAAGPSSQPGHLLAHWGTPATQFSALVFNYLVAALSVELGQCIPTAFAGLGIREFWAGRALSPHANKFSELACESPWWALLVLWHWGCSLGPFEIRYDRSPTAEDALHQGSRGWAYARGPLWNRKCAFVKARRE
jgi:hypothetical protein